jgi:hypothetical protein
MPAHAAQYETSAWFSAITVTETGISLSGTVINTGTDPLYSAEAILWVNPDPITTLAELNEVANAAPDEDLEDRLDTSDAAAALAKESEAFQPQATARFTVSATWEELGVTADGVYQVGIHVRASDVSWGDRVTIGRAATLVTLALTVSASTATVVLLTSAPSLLYDNVFADRHLADELSGRLRALLHLAAQPEVAWVVDPGLLHELSIMAEDHKVLENGLPVETRANAVAEAWLKSFSALDFSQGNRFPWGNPDLALGLETGDSALFAQLTAVEQAYSWPQPLPLLIRSGNGLVDDAYLNYLASLEPLIVLGQAKASALLPYGRLLNTTVTPFPAVSASDVDLERYQYTLAELAISQETVIRVIETEGDAVMAEQKWPSWVRTVRLSEIQPTTSWTADLSIGQAGGRLTPATTTHLAQARQTVVTYGSLIGAGADISESMLIPLSFALSGSWSGDAAAANYLNQVVDPFTDQIAKVTIAATSEVALSSRTATFPVTITNGLSVPIHIRLDTVTTPVDRSPANISVASLEQIVNPGDRWTANLSAKVIREGTVDAIITVKTQDGQPTGAVTTIRLVAKAGAWMGWALVVSAFVLFVAGTFLRVKAARRGKGKGVANEGDTTPGT